MTEQDLAPRLDYASLKSGGIILQRDGEFYALRLRLPGGRITADQLQKVAEVAKRYGRGEVRLTARQGLEIPWIRFAEIEAARRELSMNGIVLGPCGPRFRTATACPGLPVCRLALADSQSFALRIDRLFGGRQLPHKFKASVSACPNGCSKPLENELGFCAAVQPRHLPALCKGCGLCLDICRERALVLQGERPALDGSRCILCGDCVQCCPSDAWRIERKGYTVYAGGMMGRHPRLGEKIADFVDEDQGLRIIEHSLDLFRARARPKERFGDLLSRLGVDEFKAAVLKD